MTNEGGMSDEVITHLDQVTPGWLTRVLTRGGALEAGVVQAFESESQQRPLSTIAKLRLTYGPDAKGKMPRRLLLKLVDVNTEFGSFGRSEVDYYLSDYVGVVGAPLVQTYDGAHSPEEGRYHLLMDDLSETHMMGVNKTVTLEHGLALAEGLAAMHAHWWGEERLKQGRKSMPGTEEIDRYVEFARPGVEPVLDYCSDQLKPHWPALLREIFDQHPRMMVERARDDNGFTLIHGDVNRTNILVPIRGDRPLYIIDRQPFDWSLITWLATFDLSLPIVLWWDVDTRRKYESNVLRRYHDHLIQIGIRGYSMEQLLADYKLSALMGVYVATEWCRNGLREDQVWIWKPKLERTLIAFDDLDCRTLWA